MEGGTKNLCAQIPIDLHRKVREYQEQSGKSLGEYMTWLITTFYQFEEEQKMTREAMRFLNILRISADNGKGDLNE